MRHQTWYMLKSPDSLAACYANFHTRNFQPEMSLDLQWDKFENVYNTPA